MVLAGDLDQAASGFVVQRKILDQVQKTAFLASAARRVRSCRGFSSIQ